MPFPEKVIETTDYAAHTCPDANNHLDSVLADVKKTAETYVDYMVREFGDLVQSVHDKNHELRDHLRDAMEDMAKDYNELLDAYHQKCGEVEALERVVDDLRDDLRRMQGE